MGAVGEYPGAYVHVLRTERTLDDGVCGEVGQRSEDYGGGKRGYGDESRGKTPKLEWTGLGADPVHATGPENSRGNKLIGFGKLFGLQDIYESDEVRVQGGVEQTGSSSSTSAAEKKWQDQVDGLSDKWGKVVKKTVHFWEVRRTPKEIRTRMEWERRRRLRCH